MDFTPDRPDVVRWFRNIRRSGHSAKRVITGSQYIKDDLVRRLAPPRLQDRRRRLGLDRPNTSR